MKFLAKRILAKASPTDHRAARVRGLTAAIFVAVCGLSLSIPAAAPAFPGPFYRSVGAKIAATGVNATFTFVNELTLTSTIGAATVKIKCTAASYKKPVLFDLTLRGKGEIEEIKFEDCSAEVPAGMACEIAGEAIEFKNLNSNLGYETTPTAAEVNNRMITVPIVNDYTTRIISEELTTVKFQNCANAGFNGNYKLKGGFIAKTTNNRVEEAAVGQELSPATRVTVASTNCNGTLGFRVLGAGMTFQGSPVTALSGAFNMALAGNLGLFDE
jgi:hypothetical protein